MRAVIVWFCAFWLKRGTVCFRLLRLTTLTMVQLSFLLSIHYPSRLSGSDFQRFPHCPVGFTHSITDNECHSRVTPNGRSGISAIQDMTFLSQLIKPDVRISRIRLSFGIVPYQEMDSSFDASTGLNHTTIIPPTSHILTRWRFSLLYFGSYLSGILFIHWCYHADNLDSTKARTPSLSWVFSSYRRPLHPAAQVRYIIGSTIITTMSSSDFLCCIGLAFPSGYTSPTCAPSPEFIDPETCRM